MKYLLVAPTLALLTFVPVARAADVCMETVPATRFIDGVPAYAQCAASTNSAIYSDNGINTSTSSGGAGWVRTQGSGGYQCTELAHRYLRFLFNVASVPNGNAGVWCDATLPGGLVKATVPVHGDLIVLAPGSCGADGTTGHVAVVDTVAADMASVVAVQQNPAGRSRYNTTCAACFLHATANGGRGDGGVTDAGSGADGPVSPGSGGRMGGTGGRGGNAAGGGGSGVAGAPQSTGGAPASGGTPGGTGGGAGTGGMSGGTGGGGGGGDVGTKDGGAGIDDPEVGTGCACAFTGHSGGFAPVWVLVLLTIARRRRRSRMGVARGRQDR
jgi:MYXO-CTERM domain-containing protein